MSFRISMLLYVVSLISGIWLLLVDNSDGIFVCSSNFYRLIVAWYCVFFAPGYLILKALRYQCDDTFSTICISFLLSMFSILLFAVISVNFKQDLATTVKLLGANSILLSIYCMLVRFTTTYLNDIKITRSNIFSEGYYGIALLCIPALIGVFVYIFDQGGLFAFSETSLHLATARQYIELPNTALSMISDYPGRIKPAGIELWEYSIAILSYASQIDILYLVNGIQALVAVLSLYAYIFLINQIFNKSEIKLVVFTTVLLLSFAGLMFYNERFMNWFEYGTLGFRMQLNHGSIANRIGVPATMAILLRLFVRGYCDDKRLIKSILRGWIICFMMMVAIFYIHPPKGFFDLCLYITIVIISMLTLDPLSIKKISINYIYIALLLIASSGMSLGILWLLTSNIDTNTAQQLNDLPNYDIGSMANELKAKMFHLKLFWADLSSFNSWFRPRGLDDKMGLSLLLPFACSIFLVNSKSYRLRLLSVVYIIVVLTTFCFSASCHLINAITYSQMLILPGGIAQLPGLIVVAIGLYKFATQVQKYIAQVFFKLHDNLLIFISIIVSSILGVILNAILTWPRQYYNPINMFFAYALIYYSILLLLIQIVFTIYNRGQSNKLYSANIYQKINSFSTLLLFAMLNAWLSLVLLKYCSITFDIIITGGLIFLGGCLLVYIIVRTNRAQKIKFTPYKTLAYLQIAIIIAIAFWPGITVSYNTIAKHIPNISVQLLEKYGLDKNTINFIKMKIPKGSIIAVEPLSNYYPSLVASVYTFPVPQNAVSSIPIWKKFYKKQKDGKDHIYKMKDINTEQFNLIDTEEIYKEAQKFKINYYMISPWRVDSKLIKAFETSSKFKVRAYLPNGMLIVETIL